MRKMTWVVAGATAAVVLAGSAAAAASQRATAGAPAAQRAVAARESFTWSSFTSPVGGTQLAGVWAGPASDVWAVGETGCPSVQNGRTLALHWNGSAWSIVKTPNPGFFP